MVKRKVYDLSVTDRINTDTERTERVCESCGDWFDLETEYYRDKKEGDSRVHWHRKCYNRRNGNRKRLRKDAIVASVPTVEETVFLQFVAEECVFGDDLMISFADLYHSYQEWNIRMPRAVRLSAVLFGKLLIKHYPSIERGRKYHQRQYFGISTKELAPCVADVPTNWTSDDFDRPMELVNSPDALVFGSSETPQPIEMPELSHTVEASPELSSGFVHQYIAIGKQIFNAVQVIALFDTEQYTKTGEIEVATTLCQMDAKTKQVENRSFFYRGDDARRLLAYLEERGLVGRVSEERSNQLTDMRHDTEAAMALAQESEATAKKLRQLLLEQKADAQRSIATQQGQIERLTRELDVAKGAYVELQRQLEPLKGILATAGLLNGKQKDIEYDVA